MEKPMIDYHCHLLPSLDDGASDLNESLQMARILCGFGFTTVYCTPHKIKGWYENDPPRVASTTRTLQGLLEQAGIPLRLIPGGEHYVDEFLPEQLRDAPTIGAAKSVLVEVPFQSGPELLPPMLAAFAHLGLTPLIAHPERCRAFEPAVTEQGLRGALSLVMGKPKPQGLEANQVVAIKEQGCRFQGNLGSFSGYYGREVKERALLFLRHGVYSCLGSDAHRNEGLEGILSGGLAAVVAEVGEEAASELLKGLQG